MEDQLAIASSNVERLNIEVNILRQSRYDNERISLMLEELQATVQRADVEKTQRLQSQLESIQLERDNLKNLIENINEQNTKITNELRVSFVF